MTTDCVFEWYLRRCRERGFVLAAHKATGIPLVTLRSYAYGRRTEPRLGNLTKLAAYRESLGTSA